ASSTTPTCGSSASRRQARHRLAAAGRQCCTARARPSSPTKTARSRTRTRSRPASTTRASARSTHGCATAAAPSTSVRRTTRHLQRSATSPGSRGSSRRSNRRMRSHACANWTRNSCSCASRVAATRISPRCLHGERRLRERAAVVVHVPELPPGGRAALAHADGGGHRRHRARVPRSGRRWGGGTAPCRHAEAAGDAARRAAVVARPRPARALCDRGHRRAEDPRRRKPPAVRSDARHRRARVLAIRRGAGPRRRNTRRPHARRGLTLARDQPRRGARPRRQHHLRASARARGLRARGRQAPAPPARREARRRNAVRARGVKTLVIYLMAGKSTPELAAAAVDGGADIIELGFPFSDPLADGPVIRHAGERALAEGMRTQACLDCLARTRELVGGTPLVPMTFAALLEAYGWDRFATAARAAGASSLIVADLPAGERPELRRVQLVAPTSTDERLAVAAQQTDGWLYLVTLTGTTGARAEVSPALAALV